MIDFIYIVCIVIYAMLFFSIYFKEYVLGLLSGFALMLAGVYLAINGAGSVNNFLTSGFAVVSIALGFYVVIQGSTEEAEKNLNEMR